MRLIQSCALISLLLTGTLCASEVYDERKISHIEVVIDCDNSADPTPVLARLKTKEGDEFSQSTFDSDLKLLSNEYDKVEPSIYLQNGQVYIVVHVSPKPVIHQIRWEGNYQFSTSSLQEELDIQPNTVFNRPAFNKAFNKVKEYYFKKGYFESQLSYHLEPIAGTNEVDIVIHVNEGRPGHIKSIVLKGFSKEEKSDIEEQMYMKQYNFLWSWITGTGIYRDEALDQDRMTILNYLQNRGYADARVDIHLLDDPSGKLIVEITAYRGPLYHLGAITYTGNSIIPLDEIIAKSHLKAGDVYSSDKLRDTAQAIKDLYGQKGYIDTSVQFETVLMENEPVFDIHFTIDEGARYKVGLIHIYGNSSTKSNVILRESLLVPGETFDSRKLKATQQRLEGIGYFKSVNVYAVRTQDDENLGDTYRDVYIEVDEVPTGNISLFGGFSTVDDVFGGLDLTERNFNLKGLPKALGGKLSSLRGGGEFFHVRGTVGKKQNSVLVSWLDPYVNDTLWRLGVEISRTFSKLQKDVVVTTYGGSVYTSYPLSTYWTAGARQRIRHSKDNLNLDPLDDSALAQASVAAVREQLNQDGLISGFSANVSYDSTDNAYKPHRGWRSYFETEVVGLGGKYEFFKITYTNAIYFPVWRKGTLKLRGDFRYIVPFGNTTKETVPYSERFFLGGDVSGRGYKPFLLGPLVRLQNSAGVWQDTDTPYGGISSTFASLEYNQEVFRLLDVFGFVDAGSVAFGEFSLQTIRPSAGVGARIDIGNRVPVMVGWGVPLLAEDRNDTRMQQFFFSMGGQF